MIAKYFATSFAIENVVSAPRVISNCLPISTISMSFVGIRVEIDHVPGFLCRLRAGVHRDSDVGLRQRGASLVPSPVIATSLPSACSRLISAILSSGVASSEKVVNPRFVGD